MKDGFVKVCTVTPRLKVADTVYNADEIIANINMAAKAAVKICVFPELAISGYTCGELFLQSTLLASCEHELRRIIEATKGLDMICFVGLPFGYKDKIYNAVAAISHGQLLGIVPKRFLPNYSEFYEERYFASGFEEPVWVDFLGCKVPFGMNLIFRCKSLPELKISAEICEDAWVPGPPSVSHALAGATVIVNSSASNELVGKQKYRKRLIESRSATLACAYIYANAGRGESSTDVVFSGASIIAEYGNVLAKSEPYTYGLNIADIDVEKLVAERRRMNCFETSDMDMHTVIDFDLKIKETKLTRYIDPHPFVPEDEWTRDDICDEILDIQAHGLVKRLEHIGAKDVVIGISGGLDSTLALLICDRAFNILEYPKKGIHAVTMPCFGTSDRTYENACELMRLLETDSREVDIKKSVLTHLEDIGHDADDHNVTYENAQARERTQVIMDIANEVGGLVIGTGDLSEIALGWCTYGGDHLSMYAVNASVPKTLVRHLVDYYARIFGTMELEELLLDILDTPVSPELLPTKAGVISQQTEDIVGPYELHDFFLYHMMRFGCRPRKIYRMACTSFKDKYDRSTILKWLKVFYKRFFSQQFKRSCMPDGPKVGSVALSPRGDLRMPSDACVRIWMDELEEIEA